MAKLNACFRKFKWVLLIYQYVTPSIINCPISLPVEDSGRLQSKSSEEKVHGISSNGLTKHTYCCNSLNCTGNTTRNQRYNWTSLGVLDSGRSSVNQVGLLARISYLHLLQIFYSSEM